MTANMQDYTLAGYVEVLWWAGVRGAGGRGVCVTVGGKCGGSDEEGGFQFDRRGQVGCQVGAHNLGDVG